MARLSKLVKPLAFIGIAYWYWTGPYQDFANAPSTDEPKKNAQIIAECVARGDFAQAGNYSDRRENPEYICANENNLYRNNAGEWHHR
jgi:hypothetical protein